jgi:hypothetical protein
MYRDLLGQYGFWDQLRVDHGREFFLMLYLQHKFQVLRFDVNKRPFVQSTSKQNRIIERNWHELNQRFIYSIKEFLVKFENNNIFNLEIESHKFSVITLL